MERRGQSIVDLEHERAWRLLPWLANGTLEGEELATLLDHLKRCRTCLDELRFLPELRAALEADVGEIPAADAVLGRVFERIDDYEAGAGPAAGRRRDRRPAGAGTAERRSGIAGGRRLWIPAVLAAQAAAIVLLAAALLLTPPEPPGAVFQTLSSPHEPLHRPAQPPLSQLTLVLADGALEAELRELVRGVGGEIVAGPSILGAYTVALAPGSRLDEALDDLRRRPAVALVQPKAEPRGTGAR